MKFGKVEIQNATLAQRIFCSFGIGNAPRRLRRTDRGSGRWGDGRYLRQIPLLALLTLWTSVFAEADERLALNFNSDWRMGLGEFEGAEKVDFDDSQFEAVTLPRAWNEDDAFHLDIHNHRKGVAWYRKRFVLPERTDEGKVYIEFEGARQLAEVWVNGERVRTE